MIEEKDLSAPISKALLAESQRFAVILPGGIAGGRGYFFELYFFIVMRRYPLHRTYDTEMPEIAAGGISGFQFLGAEGLGRGKDILKVEDALPFRILHFGLGISPSEIWIYKSSPADTPATGWGYEVTTTVGDKHDYIPGHLSPYEMPTVASESVVYNKLSFHLGWRNSAGRAIRPSLRIFGAGYDTLRITDEELIEAMIAGKIPCRFLTVGSLSWFRYTVPEAWKESYTVDQETIVKIFGGR